VSKLNREFHVSTFDPNVGETFLASRVVPLDHLPIDATGLSPRDVRSGRQNDFFNRADRDDGFRLDAVFGRRSEPVLPKTLARRRLDFDGTVVSFPRLRGPTRWREYCKEEEEKRTNLAWFEAESLTTRDHRGNTLGAGFENRDFPLSVPARSRGVRSDAETDFEASPRNASRRRARTPPSRFSDADEERSSGEAPAFGRERLDRERLNRWKRHSLLSAEDALRTRVTDWRASVELRKRVVDRAVARTRAADTTWGVGTGKDVTNAHDGVLFLCEQRNPDNPVSSLDFPGTQTPATETRTRRAHQSLATSQAYSEALRVGGLEPMRVVAGALKATHEANREARASRAAKDAARIEKRLALEDARIRASKETLRLERSNREGNGEGDYVVAREERNAKMC
jgi:hypothetical protein